MHLDFKKMPTIKGRKTPQESATLIALLATLLLTGLKLWVSASTGSVGVFSEAIHSSLDLVSSLVTFFVVREAIKPADDRHPFGHRKIESLSALFEAFLLLVAGLYIVYEAFEAYQQPERQITSINHGIAVIALSIVVNAGVYFLNRNVGREHESIAIETNAYHFLTDVFSSAAVLLSLVIYKYTTWVWVDAAVAILIAGYVVWVGICQIQKCIEELSDTALPEGESQAIKSIIDRHESRTLGYHDLRHRRAGQTRYIEFHLSVCGEDTVHHAHTVCDDIETELSDAFKEVDVNIHVEPCGTHNDDCKEVCQFYSRPRKNI